MSIAVYARKSVERENSISCETQIDYCLSAIKPDERQEKVLTYVDNGCSGGNTDRPGFSAMMKKVRCGEVKKVIVYRLDRISRSLADFVGILSEFRRHNVEFVSSQESFDTSSPYGDLIVKILAVFAEFERSSTISRVTQAYGHRSDMGIYMGGRVPFGFELADFTIGSINTKKYSARADTLPALKMIFDSYSSGLSLSQTAARLYELFNLRFTPSKISSIIRNPVYVRADNLVYGYYASRGVRIVSPPESFDAIHGAVLYGVTRHDKSLCDLSDIKLVVMPHEGIVSSKLWMRCVERLVENAGAGRSGSNPTSYLSGILKCRNCGSVLTTVKGIVNKYGDVRRYFVCPNKRDCVGIRATLYAESLEKMVNECFERVCGFLPKVKRDSDCELSSRINSAKNSINAVVQSQKRLVDKIASEELTESLKKLCDAEAVELEAKKAGLEKELSRLEKLADSAFEYDFTSKFYSSSQSVKKCALRVLFDRIEIDNAGNAEIFLNF